MRGLTFLAILFLLCSFIPEEDKPFKEGQMENLRVYLAFQEKWEDVQIRLDEMNIDSNNLDVFIRVFKFEEVLELWAKTRDSSKYQLLESFRFCENVGELGPKRKEGDKQIPEGAYFINKFNPNSAFHLSLKVSYPNRSDTILGFKPKLGGQIFIHGGCSTIGCVPITDDKIKELYVYCVQAQHTGQLRIPVHIFPARLTQENWQLLYYQVQDSAKMDMWNQLKIGYDLFEETNAVPPHAVNELGQYFFRSGT